MRKLLRKWLGIEETDRILALKIKADIAAKPVAPPKKGYNG
jgi:hypothetical protein